MDTILDYLTGQPVRNTPEERVRQETLQWLCETMGYRKGEIKTEFPIQMGSSKKPADIAIFKGGGRDQQNDLIGVVENKEPRSGRTKGESQLKSYMAACSSCEWGIRDYGTQREFFHKGPRNQIRKALKIPRRGESMSSANRLQRKDLKPTGNLKSIFRSILEKMYNNLGSDRTRLCNEITKILLCKMEDEKNLRRDSDTPIFQAAPGENPVDIKKKISENLWEKIRRSLTSAGVLPSNAVIESKPDLLAQVVAELERIDLTGTESDVIGTAFEIFAERYFKGEKGEFFTPRCAVKTMIEIINPKLGETALDHACGSGGFLIQIFEWISKQARSGQGRDRDITTAANSIFGIDIEPNLVKLARAYMVLIGDGHSNIIEGNSLQNPKGLSVLVKDGQPKTFDIILTNPPFGERLKIEEGAILKQFETAKHPKTGKPRPTKPPALFLERATQLLSPGGRLGIVLPEGLLGNITEKHVREFITRNFTIEAVIDCPSETFLPHTPTKTCIAFLRNKQPGPNHQILMSVVEKCGHDARGNPIEEDDFPTAAADWQKAQKRKKLTISKLVPQNGLNSSMSLVPRHYSRGSAPAGTHATIQDLIDSKAIRVRSMPCPVKQSEYTTSGGVPFLKTVGVGNFEITSPKDRVSDATYRRVAKKQDLQVGDILLVKDGNTRIGNLAILQPEDLQMVVQGHFFQIRVLDQAQIDPYWLVVKLTEMKSEMHRVLVTQTTLTALTKQAFIPLHADPPPIKEQRKIGAKAKALMQQRREALKGLQELSCKTPKSSA